MVYVNKDESIMSYFFHVKWTKSYEDETTFYEKVCATFQTSAMQISVKARFKAIGDDIW